MFGLYYGTGSLKVERRELNFLALGSIKAKSPCNLDALVCIKFQDH